MASSSRPITPHDKLLLDEALRKGRILFQKTTIPKQHYKVWNEETLKMLASIFGDACSVVRDFCAGVPATTQSESPEKEYVCANGHQFRGIISICPHCGARAAKDKTRGILLRQLIVLDVQLWILPVEQTVSETPEQRRQLKRKYREILLYLNQIAAKTGLSTFQIADCAAGNLQLGKSDTQKILDAFQTLDAPERGETNKKSSMARSKNDPRRGEPSITSDHAIRILSEQIEKGRQLQNLELLQEGDFDNWDNTTKNFAEWAFGENHPNIEHFLLQQAPTTYSPQSANLASAHYKKALGLKIPALEGYVEQLRARLSLAGSVSASVEPVSKMNRRRRFLSCTVMTPRRSISLNLFCIAWS
jgi:hypothetical protein